jgi:hypothetical protein
MSAPIYARAGKHAIIKLPFTIAVMASLVLPLTAAVEDVPDDLSVEWQGKLPCEKSSFCLI